MTAHATAGFQPTAAQREAIEAPLGPVVVLAGPGAGKTSCLIGRIQYLVERMNFAPGRICAVTFTNKAAEEIAGRLENALGARAGEVTRSTLHALAVDLLREYGEAIGLPRGFGIADEEYQLRILVRLGVFPEGRRRFLLRQFGLHRLRGDVLSHSRDAALFERYREHLATRGLLDFDDLILRTEQLLRQRDDIANLIAGRWDYVLVDEGQDLNPTQYGIVRRLARDHGNLFIVGDDEQSIYSWAGADPAVLKRAANDFHATLRIVLDRNHRCSRQIFDAARRVLLENPSLFDKGDLKADRESEHPVVAYVFEDDAAETAWLLDDLVRDRAASGLTWGDYGILYRRHVIGDALEGALLAAGIPCRLAEGRALQDDPVVGYLLAALRVIAAPGDPGPIAGFLRRVLPDTLVQELAREAERRGRDVVEIIEERARHPVSRDDESGRKVRRAFANLGNLRAVAEQQETLAGLIQELLSRRVGEYTTPLEDLHHELSDPADDPAVVALAGRLEGALHGRRRVWLPRMGGLEIALAGLLSRAGLTMVSCEGEDDPRHDDDVTVGPAAAGRHGLALTVFKALQLVHSRALADAFRDFVAFDVETTDNTPDTCDIVEIAAVRVRGGQIVDEYQSLVRPTRPIHPKAQEKHGITDEAVASAPPFADVWPGFRAFVGGDILVAHNGYHFDFPVLRRHARGEADAIVTFDTLPLARQLHPGSRTLSHLAERFGIDAGRSHRALDDARTLAHVLLHLERLKRARARKTALSRLLDWLGLALALADPAELMGEAKDLFQRVRVWTLGFHSDALEWYERERERPGAGDTPTVDEVVLALGGRQLRERLRTEKTAHDRYPAAMARLERLLAVVPDGPLADQIAAFLERVALSRSDGAETDRTHVNLLTLHATKGLEFSRVYIVGVEDDQLPGRRNGEIREEELPEARRLLYVGMTRARDRLVLTRALRRGGLETGGARLLEEAGLQARAGPRLKLVIPSRANGGGASPALG